MSDDRHPTEQHDEDSVPAPPKAAGPLASAGFIVIATLIGIMVLIFAIGGADILSRSILSPVSDVSSAAKLSITLLSMQFLIVVAVIAAPGLLQSARNTLALSPPRVSPETYSLIFWATVVFVAVSYFLAFTVFRAQFVSDLQTFTPLLQSEAWPVAMISIAVGAPVAEELLFRGLLLGWLLQRGVAFWTAALSTNVMWTLLHLGYSFAGLIEVFLAGVLLSWAFYLTRSVWVPMLIHAAYNSTALIVMIAAGI